MSKGYIAYNLTEASRAKLLGEFPPKFSKVVAHHITLQFGVDDSTPLPPTPQKAEVIGYACNDKIECVVARVDNQERRAVDGKLLHITLSHSDEAKPVMSNDLLTDMEYTPVSPIEIIVEPTFNKF
jgi:hypothetical protein